MGSIRETPEHEETEGVRKQAGQDAAQFKPTTADMLEACGITAVSIKTRIDVMGESGIALGPTLARLVLQELQHAELAAEYVRKLERDRDELLEALKALCVSHENLYRSVFGETADPTSDIIRREAEDAIAKAESSQ